MVTVEDILCSSRVFIKLKLVKKIINRTITPCLFIQQFFRTGNERVIIAIRDPFRPVRVSITKSY